MTEEEEQREWDQQENENNNHYYFFLEFRDHQDNITIPRMYEKIKEELKKGSTLPYKLPKWSTFENWASVNKWIDRKKAYWDDIYSKVSDEIYELSVSSLVEKFRLDSENRLLISKEINNILKDKNFKGNKAWNIEKLMRANKDGLEIERLIAGEPTEIVSSETRNSNLNMEIGERLNKTQEILGSDEFRKHEIGLLNVISKKQRGNSK